MRILKNLRVKCNDGLEMGRKAKWSVGTRTIEQLGFRPKADSGDKGNPEFHVKPVPCSLFEVWFQVLAIPSPKMKLKK